MPTGSPPLLFRLYPARTQADAFDAYQAEAVELAGQGWFPIAHSWGDDRPGAGAAFFAANVEEAYRTGTLLVTYRRDAPVRDLAASSEAPSE